VGAAPHAVPTVYYSREFAEAGGLMSYEPHINNVHELIASIRAASSKARKPADLPVAQPTKFEMVINLSTAKALAIDVPATLLALVGEVI